MQAKYDIILQLQGVTVNMGGQERQILQNVIPERNKKI